MKNKVLLVNDDIELGNFEYLYGNVYILQHIMIIIYYYTINGISQYSILNFFS